MKKILTTPEMEQLADRIGEFIQYWGFKKIHGRIWAHLYLSANPLDATTLVKRLKVSKALVSFSIHDLLEYAVIREVAKGRGRTVLYEANPDVTAVILNVLKTREKDMLLRVMRALRSLEVSPGTARSELILSSERISEMKSMIESAQQVLDHVIRTGTPENDIFIGFRQVMKK